LSLYKQLLSFDFDPALHSDADPHLASKNNADPDPQHWLNVAVLIDRTPKNL
jgi:hypothetical protein